MAGAPTTKIVRCCHCRGMMKVPARAFSVFCPHCQKRAPLENLRIVGSHPGKSLATCGDITVEATAKLNLSIIADNVTVHGRIRGDVQANQTVEVGATAQVIGNINAAKIIVHDGATIEGLCTMAGLSRVEPPTPGASSAGAIPPPGVTPMAADLPHSGGAAGSSQAPLQRGWPYLTR